jgi:hypothetical protein
MSKQHRPVALMLALVVSLPSAAISQDRHAVDSSALAAAVARHLAAQEADRAAVREALSRPEMQKLVSLAGTDVARLNLSVATMNDAALQRTAAAVRLVNKSLVGGQVSSHLIVPIAAAAVMVAILVFVVRDYPNTCFQAKCYPETPTTSGK